MPTFGVSTGLSAEHCRPEGPKVGVQGSGVLVFLVFWCLGVWGSGFGCLGFGCLGFGCLGFGSFGVLGFWVF